MISNYYIPQWEERTSYGVRRVDPYTKLFGNWTVLLGTPISDDIANAVMIRLLYPQLMDAERQISIYIDSPGGLFTALTIIYNVMHYARPDVQTVCLGQAVSAVALLFVVGTKGKRLVFSNNRILIYQPVMEGGYGQGSDLEIQTKEIMRIRESTESMPTANIGQAVMKVSHDIERDKYLTTQGAVKYRIVDNILTSLKDIGA